jgi:hypothetical protein
MMTTVRSDSLGRPMAAPVLRRSYAAYQPQQPLRRPQPVASLAGIVRALGIVLLMLGLLRTAPAQAQSPALLDMVNTLSANGVYAFNGLERQAAMANDNAFTKLQPICAPAPKAPTAGCTGPTLTLFNRLRELEDNANELLGNRGETQYSLRLDPKGISEALRWTAPEEYAAQGSM